MSGFYLTTIKCIIFTDVLFILQAFEVYSDYTSKSSYIYNTRPMLCCKCSSNLTGQHKKSFCIKQSWCTSSGNVLCVILYQMGLKRFSVLGAENVKSTHPSSCDAASYSPHCNTLIPNKKTHPHTHTEGDMHVNIQTPIK